MCWLCDHPEATKEEYLKILVETIEEHRWVVQYVVGRDRPFAYTVGLHALGLPELLITGLKEDASVRLLNSAAHDMVYHGTLLEPAMQIDFEDELVLEVVEVDHPDIHLMMAVELYGRAFRAMQLVWTDDDRHWPWDRGWSQGRRRQPVFGVRGSGRLNAS